MEARALVGEYGASEGAVGGDAAWAVWWRGAACGAAAAAACALALAALLLHRAPRRLLAAASPPPPLQPHAPLLPYCKLDGTSTAARAVGPTHPRLTRTPSISSQSSLDSATSRHASHRGSSPQIRTYAPDGRTLEGAGPGSPGVSGGTRSPSPLRAASLDARSPLAALHEAQAPSPLSPRHGPAPAPRCLSPLLMPPRRMDRSNSLAEGAGAPLSPGGPGSSTGAAAVGGSLGALQPDLYTRREAPLHIGLAGPGPSLGRLHLRLNYDFDRSDLEVHLIEALGLCDGQEGFTEPYVRCALEPAVDTRERQTPVLRDQPNPYFDHSFKFPVPLDDLADRTLLLQVFDYDRFSRNETVGIVRVGLGGVCLAGGGGGAEVWAEVAGEARPPHQLQELLLSLSYLPSAERLTVTVLQARNLLLQHAPHAPHTPHAPHNTEVFVKVYLLVNGKRAKKKKTNRREATAPVWNEALSFSLPAGSLAHAGIEVCVVSGGETLGWCAVGGGEEGAAHRHWALLDTQPRTHHSMWHTLR